MSSNIIIDAVTVMSSTTAHTYMLTKRHILSIAHKKSTGESTHPTVAYELPNSSVTDYFESVDGTKITVFSRAFMFYDFNETEIPPLLSAPTHQGIVVHDTHALFGSDYILGVQGQGSRLKLFHVRALLKPIGNNNFRLDAAGLYYMDGIWVPIVITCRSSTPEQCSGINVIGIDVSRDDLVSTGTPVATVLKRVNPSDPQDLDVYILVYNPNYTWTDGKKYALWVVRYAKFDFGSRRMYAPLLSVDEASTLSELKIVVGKQMSSKYDLWYVADQVTSFLPPDAHTYDWILYAGVAKPEYGGVLSHLGDPDYAGNKRLLGFTNGFVYLWRNPQGGAKPTPYVYLRTRLGIVYPLFFTNNDVLVVAKQAGTDIEVLPGPCDVYVSNAPNYRFEVLKIPGIPVTTVGSLSMGRTRLRATSIDAAGISIDTVTKPQGTCTDISDTDMYNIEPNIESALMSIKVTGIDVS